MVVHVDRCSYEDRLLASHWSSPATFYFCSRRIGKLLPRVLHRRSPVKINNLKASKDYAEYAHTGFYLEILVWGGRGRGTFTHSPLLQTLVRHCLGGFCVTYN